MPAPNHSVFTGWMPFLMPNQQRQSTEVLAMWVKNCHLIHLIVNSIFNYAFSLLHKSTHPSQTANCDKYT